MKSIFKKIVVVILTWEARLVIKKYKPDIIAVTGSVGKTSTKDAIYTLISPKVYVRKSDKSFNTEIGLPLTILGCENGWGDPLKWVLNILHGLSLILYPNDYPECLVLEIGADHPKDIKNLTKWFHPDIAVITAVSKIPVHVEFFSSPKEVLEEKLALVRGVKKANPKVKAKHKRRKHRHGIVAGESGKVVLPAHDNDILAVLKEPAMAGVSCLTFGINSGSEVTASQVSILYEENSGHIKNAPLGKKYPAGMTFNLNYAGNSVPVSIKGIVGFQQIYSMVAATAAALAYGVSFDDIVKAIPTHVSPKGRMNVLRAIGDSILIDDTYNASPDAVKEALAVLCDVTILPSVSRKIAVLGDMMELGKFSSDQHKHIGEMAAHALLTFPTGETMPSEPNLLVTVGIRARDIALGAIASGMSADTVVSFDTSSEAAEYVRKLLSDTTRLNDGALVLVKGSQSARLERVSRAILADEHGKPADEVVAAKLLVRQDPEWLARA